MAIGILRPKIESGRINEFKRKKEGDVPIASGVLWVKTDKGETSYELKHTFQP